MKSATELFDTTCHFGKPIRTKAACRNAIGRVAEVFVSRSLDVDILPVDGSKKVCPDFEGGEIKSVGKSNSVLLYQWRLSKEAESFDPKDYFYVFVRHTCPITITNTAEIVEHFAKNTPRLICTSLHELLGITRGIKPKKFKWFGDQTVDQRIGYYRKGYDQGGWQFSLSRLKIVQGGYRTCKWNGSDIGVRLFATKGAKKFLKNQFTLRDEIH